MERVDRATALDHWLANERAVDGTADVGSDDRVAALLDAKPGAAHFLVRDTDRAWHRTAVQVADLADWRLVETAPDALWGALSPDHTVGGAARRVADGDPAALTDATGVDVKRLWALADDHGTEPAPALVARTRRGRVPTTVADGNHRAVARVLAALEGVADPAPQPAYVGVAPNPILRPARERLAGLVDRLLAR